MVAAGVGDLISNTPYLNMGVSFIIIIISFEWVSL